MFISFINTDLMLRSFLAFFLVVSFIGTAQVRAQDDPDGLNVRASYLLDSTMAALNLRAVRFNEELDKINAVKPLDVSSLDNDMIPKNREKVKDFLEYLAVYRALSEKLKQTVEDSVNTLRAKMPSRHKATFLKDFQEAYDLDQGTFDKYILALTQVFQNIYITLGFIENSGVTYNGTKYEFKK